LLSLREENLFVSDEYGPEALVLLSQRAKSLNAHDGSDARKLNNSFVERNSAIESRTGSYYTVPADRGRFYHIPDAKFDDERDDPRVRKVDATD